MRELDDFLVLTSNNKPVAAIVSLRNIDPESLALSTNAEFFLGADPAVPA